MASEAISAKAGYHHGDLVAALISQARELVAANGADHVSMREVAAKIGVSPSAVYHHFPDKDALLGALGRTIFEELADEQETASKAIPGKSATATRKRFRAIGVAYFSFAKSNPNLFRLCFGPLCAMGKFDEKANSRAWQLLVSGLEEMSAIGAVDPAVRPNAEILVWAAIHGSSMLVLDGLLPEEAIHLVLDSIEVALQGAAPVTKLKTVNRVAKK